MAQIHDRLRIDVSGDGLLATALPVRRAPRSTVKVRHVVALLRDCGVTFGVDEAAIREFLRSWQKEQSAPPVVVARGLPAKPATSSELRRILPPPRSGKDPIELLPLFVKAGETLFSVRPGSPGSSGRDVRGREIPVPPSDQNEWVPGPGIRVHANQWIAARTGFLESEAARISVASRLLHQRDLPVAEYEWSGNVTIQGNVETGTRLKASGDVEIVGHIADDVRIVAGGGLRVDGDVEGRATELLASGDIHLRSVHHADIRAKGDIFVSELCRDAHCRTYQSFHCSDSGSLVIGGKVEAVRAAFLFDVGGDGIRTEVVAGTSDWIYDEIRKLEDEIRSWEKHYMRVHAGFQARFSHLIQNRADIYRLPDDQREQYEDAQAAVVAEQRRIEEVISGIRGRQMNLSRARGGSEGSVVRIEGHAHPGSHFTLRRRPYVVSGKSISDVALTLASKGKRVIAIPRLIYDSSHEGSEALSRQA